MRRGEATGRRGIYVRARDEMMAAGGVRFGEKTKKWHPEPRKRRTRIFANTIIIIIITPQSPIGNK